MYSIFFKDLNMVNWEAVSAITSIFEICLLFVPTILVYLYVRVVLIDCWIYNETKNGLEIAIHNKGKTSIYILNLKIIKTSSSFCKAYVYCETFICIKPDEMYPIHIDYQKYSLTQTDSLKLEMNYGGKKRKLCKKIR